MKMTFHQYRIIIEVFRSFGILTSGQWKNKSFIDDFRVNQLYVRALLFELELRLGIYLEEEALDRYCCPQSILLALCDGNHLNRSSLSLIHGLVSSEQKLSSIT